VTLFDRVELGNPDASGQKPGEKILKYPLTDYLRGELSHSYRSLTHAWNDDNQISSVGGN
jgi:hypothetical protein